MNFRDKVAIVTGGTGALGRVIVNHFAKTGMKVYVPVRSLRHFMDIFDESQKDVELTVLLRRYAIECDAFDEAQVEEFCGNVVKQEGRIDFLANTIGGYHPKKLVREMDSSLIEDQLKLNFYTTFYFTRHSLTHMKTRNFGRVISVGAKPAVEVTAGKFAYALSKAGVVSLMQTLALEHKHEDFTFNTIIPNIIDTPANRTSMPNSDFSKWTRPEEIAEKCLELVSDESKKLNGEVVKIYD